MYVSIEFCRSMLAELLNGKITIQQFYNWFVVESWYVSEREDILDAKTRDKIGELTLRFAEYTSGHWTQDDLLKKLREIYDSWPMYEARN